jgi:hypothetical protein
MKEKFEFKFPEKDDIKRQKKKHLFSAVSLHKLIGKTNLKQSDITYLPLYTIYLCIPNTIMISTHC